MSARYCPLPADAVRFRDRIVHALLRVDRKGFWYIDADSVAGVCPICGDVLSVYFAGRAPRAELICQLGCAEADVSKALGRPTRGAS
jgi:hypothetical protein